ncbi:MAG TPA: hypothetical protein VEX18_21330 [Polyangiaceae bacterium]|nr:hypothetical protein [Polyangiaceae bacterium]
MPAWISGVDGRSACAVIVVTSLIGCGGIARHDTQPEVSAGAANQPNDLADQPQSTEQPTSTTPHTADSTAGTCTQLTPPRPDIDLDELQVEYACGYRTAATERYSEFLPSGARCGEAEINTFALKLKGRTASAYSAVVRCGYIRYDNGVFVGERVQVEARDGAWCHEAALEHIELADRILLTDVSFALEARDITAPPRSLSARFSTRAGWTAPVPTHESLCTYVAHRQSGTAACRTALPAGYCVGPCGEAWQDFFQAIELSLVRR